jgi:cellulose synthase/poly-beta-1,6-N-acetylglucosamine synthase-like glycosyltransferase
MLIALQILFVVCALLLLYSYAAYPAILGLLAGAFGKDVNEGEGDVPRIAVVVPAYNEEQVIHTKIANVLSLDYPANRLSVWVGSDQSTDRTNDIVRNYGDSRVHLWVASRRGGKTEILNHLIPRVDADIVLLTDANTMHRPDSVRILVRNFADERVGAVAGHVEHVTSASDEFEERFYRSFESRQKHLESRLHSTISAFGGFYAIRSRLFEGIPPNAYSNDDVLIPMNIIRQGYRVIFEPRAVSSEDFTENIGLEFKRRMRIGAGNFQAFFWLLDFCNPLRGWPAFCYVSHKVTRWFSPLFIIGGYGSSIALALLRGSPFYWFCVFAGGAFLLAGLSFTLLRIKPLRPFFYFISMNTALFLGLFRYLSGIKSAVWTHTAR